MAARIVPVNYSAQEVANQVAKKAGQQPIAPPAPPAANELADWAVEEYSLDINTATDLGFPIGSLNAAFKRQVLLFGSSRSKDVNGGDGNTYRYGVALRALIEVSDLKVDGALTVPIVAAKVELGEARASAQLMVRGYKGAALGGLLPQWSSFGVDSYTAYMKAVSDIQAKIMADQDNISPELLATTALASALPPSATAVGMFYALDAISRKKSLLDALKGLRQDEERLGLTVKTVYSSRLGDKDETPPDQETADEARQELGELHLSRSIF